jgi:hypothetical protein
MPSARVETVGLLDTPLHAQFGVPARDIDSSLSGVGLPGDRPVPFSPLSPGLSPRIGFASHRRRPRISYSKSPDSTVCFWEWAGTAGDTTLRGCRPVRQDLAVNGRSL